MKRMSSRMVIAASCLFVLVLFSVPAAAQKGERKVEIDQVPAKVKAAILKAVGKGRLVDIGEFTEGGKKTYEIEMVVDGKEFDVSFSPDGKVLGKSFEGYKAEKKRKKPEEEAEAEEGEGEGEERGEENGEERDEEKGEERGEEEGGEMGERGEWARPFQDFFDLESREFSSTGRNRYFILEPGYRLVLEGKEGEKTVRLEVAVLDETRKFGSIETRVVEERESANGDLVEISRNFYAQDKRTLSIFYFGEEVDIYKNGEVVAHEGAWMHGEKGARAGMMMPGEALPGARYYQEAAPKVAMDRAEIVTLNAALKTPAGRFENCLRVREENPLDKEREYKTHAPGIGLVQDEGLLLVRYGFVK